MHGFVDFNNRTHHGQHNAQIIQAFAGPQHGANLNQEDFRVIEGHANATPTQKRVVFLNGEIGQRLITADIQSTHGYRRGVKRFQLLAVNFHLLQLGRKSITHHKRDFGSVQANTFGSALQRNIHIGHQAGVHKQIHSMAIGGFAGQIPHHIELFRQLDLFIDNVLILAHHFGAGLNHHFAAMAIHNQG